MNKNVGMFFGLPSWGMGAVLLALCAFTPVSRADVIVDNLPPGIANNNGSIVSVANPAQLFTMSSSDGTISALTLSLYSSAIGGGTATIDLFSTSGNAPSSFIATLGTVNITVQNLQQNIAVSLSSLPTLTHGVEYAIVMESASSGAVSWTSTTTSGSASGSGATGTLNNSWDAGSISGGSYLNGGQASGFFQMDLEAVPEVPTTGAVMGFGVLAVALGRTLRRKLYPADPAIT